MTRLRQVKPRELVAALKRAGFSQLKQIGSHLYLVDEVRDLQTCVPMHSGDVARGLLKQILKQARLTEDDLQDLL